MAFPPRNVPSPLPGPKLLNGKVAARRRNRKPLQRRSQGTPDSPLPPRRQSNASRRKREYLIPDEVEKLLQASAKLGRHGARDRTLILIAYRHGLRVSELVALRWDQVDLKAGLHVRAVSTFDGSVFTIFDGRRGAPQEPRVLFVPGTHRRECKNAHNA